MHIEVTRIPKDVLANHCIILVKGNVMLKRCAKMAGMENKEFREKLFSAGMDPSRMGVPHTVVLAVTDAVPAIKAVKALENVILSGFVCMAWKLARRASGWGLLERADAQQEALAALVDAIYGYSKLATQFQTFAYHTMYRRLRYVHNKYRPLSKWTNQAIDLMQAFEKQKNEMEWLNRVNDEQVIENMDLSEEEQEIVRKCLVATQNETTFFTFSGKSNEDYTGYRRSLEDEGKTIQVGLEVREAIEYADLTDLEMTVLKASMEPYHGWITDIAATTCNPKTKLPYSKKNISLILQKAQNKVRAAYTNNNHCRKAS